VGGHQFPAKDGERASCLVDGSIGRCKTEASQQPVSLEEIVLE
jgi:hypothetical protein